MIKLTLSEIAKIVDGTVINVDGGTTTTAYPVINSKQANPQTFFAAFVGANFDGHDFISSAISSGAQFALVSKDCSAPAIKVDDVAAALSKLASYVRSKLQTMTVIGITGSQGKTTTKDLLRHILSVSGETIAPSESLNNELGVPLLLLRCTESTKYCIVEMGARHLGDIAHLAGIAKPHIGVVLGVGKAHVGEFGSREAIAKTKSELVSTLSSDAIAILGTYVEFTPVMEIPTGVRKIFFGEKSQCEIRAADIEVREGRAHFDLVTPDGRAAVSLQLLGLHQIPNALAAAAVATSLDIPIDTISAALSTAEVSSKWRMEISEIAEITIINDSYNSNPESTSAALRTLALISQETGGVSWAFLGKMHELGESSDDEHAAIGRLVTEIGIDHLVAIGTKAYLRDISAINGGGESAVHYFESKSEALSMVDHFAPGDVLLLKASRAEEFNLLAEMFNEKLAQLPESKEVER
ncbi:MAG: UDP-N-acetylmuramoyl-tripeptide--D-alanyl-D-alanine ligase [Actinobacteria bacterium]|uniref:UDP-MurNAc-pentapeptide synthetase n=1 Tax=freshwater metagenome TaxID=449393 RepID=A0A6J6GJJ1_9ZZZZ|nr:UDP-N-acetylmuramoyl-tripeptide--D-alanyl-D-alanine ligase [Actinomycetota bacterium]